MASKRHFTRADMAALMGSNERRETKEGKRAREEKEARDAERVRPIREALARAVARREWETMFKPGDRVRDTFVGEVCEVISVEKPRKVGEKTITLLRLKVQEGEAKGRMYYQALSRVVAVE